MDSLTFGTGIFPSLEYYIISILQNAFNLFFKKKRYIKANILYAGWNETFNDTKAHVYLFL